VVYPTSTLPGLGCLPTPAALDCLFALKRRAPEQVVDYDALLMRRARHLLATAPQ
jgi:tRNA A37 threonylcarbamoyladenosine synthetase subunit TsaC/SUA5/YrdC